jgi:hypothetical protein
MRFLTVIFEEEIDNGDGDDNGKEEANSTDKGHQAVHLGGEIGGLLGN